MPTNIFDLVARPMPSHGIPKRFATSALALYLIVAPLGCMTATVQRVPADLALAPYEEARVTGGPGITLRAVDHEEVEASAVVVAPGRHVLEFDLRKSVGRSIPMMEGVYYVGSCELTLDLRPADRYRVRLRIPKATSNAVTEVSTDFSLEVYLEHQETQDEFIVSPRLCETAFDCRRVDRSVLQVPSGACKRYPGI